jgi:hypothetical protein
MSKDREFAREHLLDSMILVEGDNLTFQQYVKKIGEIRNSVLECFALVALREKLLSSDDIEKFKKLHPEDHERLPKEKETLKILSSSVIADLVRHYAFPDNAAFVSAKEASLQRRKQACAAQELVLKDRARELHMLEIELGVANPIDPDLLQWSEGVTPLLDHRFELALGLKTKFEALDASNLPEATRDNIKDGLRYPGGMDLKQSPNQNSEEEVFFNTPFFNRSFTGTPSFRGRRQQQ